MPRFAANLSMMFTEHPFLDRFDAAAKAGFSAVELTTMPCIICNALRRFDLPLALAP